MESSIMAEVLSKFESTYQVEVEPYQVEHLRLAAGTDVASLAVMQEAVNRGCQAKREAGRRGKRPNEPRRVRFCAGHQQIVTYLTLCIRLP